MEPVIPMPTMLRLWRIRLADDINAPKVGTNLMIRNAATVFDAATKAKKSKGFEAFQAKFPNAEITGVEHFGDLEN